MVAVVCKKILVLVSVGEEPRMSINDVHNWGIEKLQHDIF